MKTIVGVFYGTKTCVCVGCDLNDVTDFAKCQKTEFKKEQVEQSRTLHTWGFKAGLKETLFLKNNLPN